MSLLRRDHRRIERVNHKDLAAMVAECEDRGGLFSLQPLLSSLLKLKGKPYGLDRHFMFEPFFMSVLTGQLLLKCARQVGKSATAGAKSVAITAALEYFNTLHVTPLFEQIKRFSHQYIGPYIDTSPFKRQLIDPRFSNSVLQRGFKNQSTMFFSFAYLDAERVRGIPADKIVYDEVQGINNEFIPIIRSVTDGSDWRLSEYYGTPLTLDNTIEKLWSQTSQAEWCIRCATPGCGHINIPSIGYDLIKMIGPIHSGISETCAGLVCVKCAKPLNPRPPSKGGGGRWWHANPEQKHTFPGYHIPQTIMPQHCFKQERWSEIVGRMFGRGNTAPNQFYNETCGESYDVGTKLVSLTELRQACKLPWHNRADEAKEHAKDYIRRCISVDWSGSGGDGSQSYTTIAALGIMPGGRIDVLWGFRIPRVMDFDYEVDLIRSARKTFNVHFIAHDCNGVGFAREAMLKSRGEPLDRMMPIMAVGAMREGLMGFKPASPKRPRAFYTIDKARSIALVCQAIREGYVRFFKWDDRPGEPGLVRDFLAMKEEVVERATGSNLFQIQRTAGLPDDFAQAVVYGCMALWYPDKFPAIGDLTKYGTPSDEETIPDEDVKDLSEWNLTSEEEMQIDELE